MSFSRTSALDRHEYQRLAAQLQDAGARPYMNGRLVLAIGRTAPVLPYAGNSFGVCHVDEQWHILPWSGPVYSVPHSTEVSDICLRLLDFPTGRFLTDVPDALVAEFQLSALTPSELDRFSRAVYEAESEFPCSVSFHDFCSEIAAYGLHVAGVNDLQACRVADSPEPQPTHYLYFVLHRNHWFVVDSSVRAYSCSDEEIAGLCIYAFEDRDTANIPDDFRKAYSMTPLEDPSRSEVLAVLTRSGLLHPAT